MGQGQVMGLGRGLRLSAYLTVCTLGGLAKAAQRAAAEELEQREANRREAKKDRHLVKWSIIAGVAGAAIGATISAFVTYLLR